MMLPPDGSSVDVVVEMTTADQPDRQLDQNFFPMVLTTTIPSLTRPEFVEGFRVGESTMLETAAPVLTAEAESRPA
jgi:hypothetical protein